MRRHVLYISQVSADGRAGMGSLATEGTGRGEVWPVDLQFTDRGVEVLYSSRSTTGADPEDRAGPYGGDELLFTVSGPPENPTSGPTSMVLSSPGAATS